MLVVLVDHYYTSARSEKCNMVCSEVTFIWTQNTSLTVFVQMMQNVGCVLVVFTFAFQRELQKTRSSTTSLRHILSHRMLLNWISKSITTNKYDVCRRNTSHSHMPVLLCKVSTNTNVHIHMKFHQNKNNRDPADYCRKEDDMFKHIRDLDLDQLWSPVGICVSLHPNINRGNHFIAKMMQVERIVRLTPHLHCTLKLCLEPISEFSEVLHI